MTRCENVSLICVDPLVNGRIPSIVLLSWLANRFGAIGEFGQHLNIEAF
jgi:hypothetical protein